MNFNIQDDLGAGFLACWCLLYHIAASQLMHSHKIDVAYHVRHL